MATTPDPRRHAAVPQRSRSRLARGSAALLLAVAPWVAPGAQAEDLAPVRFSISRNGADLGLFETCRGLGTATEVIEFRDGADPSVVRKLPGRLLLTDVICTRGAGPPGNLVAWRALVVAGDVAGARSAVIISELNAAFQVIRRWNLAQAWPAELQAVGGTTATVELLRITHEGIERTQ